MNTSHCVRTFLAAIFLASGLNGHADNALVDSGERVLYGRLSALRQYNAFKGAEAKQDADTRELSVSFTKPEAGVGFRCLRESKRLDPLPYLNDPAVCLEITFRGGGAQAAPTSFYATLEAFDIYNKQGKSKKVSTQTVATDSATNLPDGWKMIRLPIAVSGEKNITGDDTIENVQLLGGSPGAFELRKIALARLRNVSIEVKNPGAPNLEIEGRTADPSAQVTVKLVNASGKADVKMVRAVSGKYQFTWSNPPLTPGKVNFLKASVSGGKNPMDEAVPVDVFGFSRDNSHVWLKVKGREIVTAPNSKGGERPFYSVGVGYARNVIVRGYDEEVATYCKSMGLNTLRLAFYTMYFNNNPAEPLNFEDITAFVNPVVEAAKRHGLYVILDDHAYFKNEIDEATARQEQKSDGWTEERFQNWVKRWVQVAAYYKDEPYVLGYELCNEPVCSPEMAQKWYRRCIEAIRKVDARHIVIVGSNSWSHSRTLERTWAGIGDKVDAPYNNVVFSFHDYPQDDNPWVVQSTLRNFQAKYNVPVMCTEFGGGGKPEAIHREFQAGMLSLFAFDKIHWMIWSLNYDRTRAVSYPSVAVKVEGEKSPEKIWKIQNTNPGYWIPFVDLWAPTARIMGSPFPEAACPPAAQN
jgi:hypothetical protein